MPAPVTTTPATSSKLLTTTNDSAVATYTAIGYVSTTAQVASVNQTGEAMFGGRPIILTTAYTVLSYTSSAYPVLSSSTSTQVTITRVVSSAPVVTTSYTMYSQIVASNTTVFSAQNTVYSLLQLTGQQGNDTVAIKNWTVVDTSEA